MSQKRKEITNYRQIERLRYIHESLSSGSYPTTQKLARDLEASTATISRDIEFLRDRYHAPCEYDPERKGFFYTEPDFQLDLFTPINREVRRKIATDKQSFAEYMNYPLKLLDKLELITDIDYPNQTELQANLSKKYIGRNYFSDGCTWVGLKAFDFCPTPLFTISYFEPYNMVPKMVSYHVQGSKLTYIAEDCSYDKGYWLYIILEHKLLETPEEVARVELKHLIDFTRKA